LGTHVKYDIVKKAHNNDRFYSGALKLISSPADIIFYHNIKNVIATQARLPAGAARNLPHLLLYFSLT
jgi:hypothetical protein